jgi:DNA helicase HerA-like ATPase
MPSVVRISYDHPSLTKTKWLQVSLNKFNGDRDEAKKYLNEKKKKIIDELNNTSKSVKFEDEVKEEDIEEDHKEEEKELVKEEDVHNYINVEINSSKKLDDIMNNLKFSKFKLDIDPHRTGSSITIFGSSKSYKTTLLKRILKQYFKKDIITVLSASNVHSSIYDDIDKHIIKTDDYDSRIVKAMYRINKRTNNKYPMTIVLDDVINVKNDSNLDQMFCTLRNSKINVIILLQHIAQLKSSARANSNIIIFRKFNQSKTINDYVMDHYLSGFPPFSDLNRQERVQLYMKITNEHHYIVLDVIQNTLIFCKEPEVY